MQKNYKYQNEENNAFLPHFERRSSSRILLIINELVDEQEKRFCQERINESFINTNCCSFVLRVEEGIECLRENFLGWIMCQ